MKKILWIHDILIGDVNYDNVDEIVVGTYFHKKYLYLTNSIKPNKKINNNKLNKIKFTLTEKNKLLQKQFTRFKTHKIHFESIKTS